MNEIEKIEKIAPIFKKWKQNNANEETKPNVGLPLLSKLHNTSSYKKNTNYKPISINRFLSKK